MAIAVYKDLCVDINDATTGTAFWSGALGLTIDLSGSTPSLEGPTSLHRVWLAVVPEPKTVKNRVHLDLHAGGVSELTDLGARVVSADDGVGWTTMTDPDGGELDVFVGDDPPDYRLYELAIDATDPLGIATWWAEVFGGQLHAGDESDWWYVDAIPGCPFDSFTFSQVPEPKTVKNRIHWDVRAGSLEPLLDAGATVVRGQDDEIRWTVMADPEGNEFCVFLP